MLKTIIVYIVYVLILAVFSVLHYSSTEEKYALLIKQPKRATSNRRFISAIIDFFRALVILLVLSIVLHIVAIIIYSGDDLYYAGRDLSVVEHCFVIMVNLLFIAAVVANHNIQPLQTYGTRLCQIRLVKKDGSSVTWTCSFLRTLLIMLTSPFIVLEFLLGREVMVHDEIMKTIVAESFNDKHKTSGNSENTDTDNITE